MFLRRDRLINRLLSQVGCSQQGRIRGKHLQEMCLQEKRLKSQCLLDRRSQNHSTQKGFTLVEVMVALTVVAVTLPALLFLLSQQVDGTAYLRDRSVAQWVAADRVAEVRLAVAKQQRASEGVIAGESERAGRTWYWRSEIQETPVPGFMRLTVTVTSEEDEADAALYTLDAFLNAEGSNASR